MVAIVFLLVKKKPKKVKTNLIQVKELIDKSQRFTETERRHLLSLIYLFEVRMTLMIYHRDCCNYLNKWLIRKR